MKCDQIISENYNRFTVNDFIFACSFVLIYFDLFIYLSKSSNSNFFMINGTTLILILSISLFWMAMSPGVPHMGYTYFNLLDSPELLQILMTLTTVIKLLLPNFLGRAIVILNFVRRFRNFIADTETC